MMRRVSHDGSYQKRLNKIRKRRTKPVQQMESEETKVNSANIINSIPDYQSLMLPVLQVVQCGEIGRKDVVSKLKNQLNITEDAYSIPLPSGKQSLFYSRVGWAKTYLAKAGLIESTRRGYFKITLRGIDVLNSNPAKIDNKFLSQFEEFCSFKNKNEIDSSVDYQNSQASELIETSTPDEIMRAAHKQVEAALADDLLARVRLASPEFFERLIVNLLLAMGYGGSVQNAGQALGKSGDDGIDGVIDQDELGLDRVYIQAKRYTAGNNVGSAAIRDFFGSLDRHKANKGLFVTTSVFTKSARDTVEHLSKRIVLIDGEQLAGLMVRHNVGCRIEENLYVRKLDEDFFE